MRGSARIAAAAGLLALSLALVLVGPARAELGPIRLVSKDSLEQAEFARDPALAAAGRYLAFQAAIGGREGVFREDLSSGELAPVAVGNAYEANAPDADASAPSISADGRYVSFTTKTRLDPADDLQPLSSDVYVADMSASPPTYELASALDGCNPATSPSPCGIEYEGSGGSQASGGVSLSADGRRVAFVTTAKSDLTSGPGGSTEGTPTPAGQVLLRDLGSDRTILVSAEREPGGAMSDPPLPVQGGSLVEKPQLQIFEGAALSADGSTVAWLGTHLPAQAPLLSDEATKIAELDANGSFPYDEPLWRRVADGAGAPIRRIVGGGDPLAPGCSGTSGNLGEAACRGPFPAIAAKGTELNSAMGWLGVAVDGVPRLSADGRQVALVGNPAEATNLFLVDMSDGRSRVDALRQLTREVPVDPTNPASGLNTEPYVPLNGHIYDLAISANGRRIAFATARQRFPLAPPNLIGTPPALVGLVELYLIDLDGESLRRVTHGSGGVGEASLAPNAFATSGAGASSPSLDLTGGLIAFSSDASNLVAGDGNDASDAFLVADDFTPPEAGPRSIPPGKAKRRPKRRWRMTLSAFSLPDGRVRLVAIVPGAGTLWVRAQTSLRVGESVHSVARAGGRARRGGRLALTLGLASRLRRLAHTHEGLYAMARVSFRHKGRKALHGELQVRFHAHPAKRKRGRR